MPYVDKDYYSNKFRGIINDNENLENYLKSASMDIDTLTFNRVVEVGFDNLTEFQQNILREVICQLADFKFSNKSILDSILSSYSINGVNMSFDKNWNIKIVNGVIVPQDLYGHLEQTGLTCRSFNWKCGQS